MTLPRSSRWGSHGTLSTHVLAASILPLGGSRDDVCKSVQRSTCQASFSSVVLSSQLLPDFSPFSVQYLERIVLHFLSFLLKPQLRQPCLCPSTWLAGRSPRTYESPCTTATCTPGPLLSFCSINATGSISHNLLSLFLEFSGTVLLWNSFPSCDLSLNPDLGLAARPSSVLKRSTFPLFLSRCIFLNSQASGITLMAMPAQCMPLVLTPSLNWVMDRATSCLSKSSQVVCLNPAPWAVKSWFHPINKHKINTCLLQTLGRDQRQT